MRKEILKQEWCRAQHHLIMQSTGVTLNRHPEIGDAEVIEEVNRGNRHIFEVLVRRHNQRLFRTGMIYLRRAETVEDAMQNTWLKVFVNLERFNGTAAFPTWLTRIMINECLLLLRKGRAVVEEPLGEEVASLVADSAETGADRSLSLKETEALLEQTIHGLPRKYRAVYVLREVQQLSIPEVAACLGIPITSVKVSSHRAREMLKARLCASPAGVELFPFHAMRCNPLTARVMAAVRCSC